ncbi:MAG: hypothetical protein EOP29_30945, partial [Rhodococcus sp. (in: high G+C Gram-positive bacteria)]
MLSVTVQALPQLGNAVTTYSVVKGVTPWGVTLNGNVLSGTILNIEPSDANAVISDAPVWQTANATALIDLIEGQAIPTNYIKLEATPQGNATVSAYYVQSGSLPWGTTLNNTTGLVSGAVSLIPTDDAQSYRAGPYIVTDSDLGSIDEGSLLNTRIVATPVIGNAVSIYGVLRGVLPWGTTLAANGALTGKVLSIEPVSDPTNPGPAPTWISNTTLLFSGDEGSTVSNVSVQATSTSNTGLAAYTIANGTMPWGVTLNSVTGAFSGTITLVEQDANSVVTMAPTITAPAQSNLGAINEGTVFSTTFLATPGVAGTPISRYSLIKGVLPWG